jgi:transposase
MDLSKMRLNSGNIKETMTEARRLLDEEKNISPALRAVIGLILVFMEVMLTRLGLNSQNSSKPPSTDEQKKKKNTRVPSNRKPGGQPGRIGKQLKPVSDPDIIQDIKIDKRTLPRGQYKESGFQARQIIDIDVSIVVTEYRAQILVDETGNRFVATFPDNVKRPIQYGSSIKAQSVYMSQYQLTPFARVQDFFMNQANITISQGSIYNFNLEAYKALASFETVCKDQLICSSRVNADETGINIDGKKHWLHIACNEQWTHFFPHKKRGCEAMNEIGILPKFKGVLCHDHWKSYYKYGCEHALCNAHHLRELEWSFEEDHQKWAGEMQAFLIKLNKKVEKSQGKLSKRQQRYYELQYDTILVAADVQCPSPSVMKRAKPKEKPKKSKSRNLLERLVNYKADVLRFMTQKDIPFTNNRGENDLRMTKVQQKISGCFRSEEGAFIFCRVRAFLITCRKHNIDVSQALKDLFKGKLPDFVAQAKLGE